MLNSLTVNFFLWKLNSVSVAAANNFIFLVWEFAPIFYFLLLGRRPGPVAKILSRGGARFFLVTVFSLVFSGIVFFYFKEFPSFFLLVPLLNQPRKNNQFFWGHFLVFFPISEVVLSEMCIVFKAQGGALRPCAPPPWRRASSGVSILNTRPLIWEHGSSYFL